MSNTDRSGIDQNLGVCCDLMAQRKSAARLLLALLIGFVVFGLSIRTVEAQVFPERMLAPPAMPTEVDVYIYAVEVASIDDNEQTFVTEARLYASWYDPRLAFDASASMTGARLYQGATAEEVLKSEIWWPYFELVDEREPRETLYLSVTVNSDGTVEYRERFRARIKQSYFLTEFPFDSHRVSFSLEPFALSGDFVRFTERQNQEGLVGWETNDWDVLGSFLEIHPGTVDSFARATVVIGIERASWYYLSNFVLPLILIVFISSAVFWMNLNKMHLSERLGVSFTSVLTIVAFDFVASESLPNLSYPTRLDDVLTLGYIFVTINIVENVISCLLYERGKQRAAQLLDVCSRWAYPATFFVAIIIALGALQDAEPVFSDTDEWQLQIDDQLVSAAESFASEGYILTSVFSDEELDVGGTFDIFVNLEQGVEYQIVGVCDFDCSDLDLEVFDSENVSVGSDYEYDDFPIVQLNPPLSDAFLISVYMADCSIEPCKWGVGIFEPE